MLGNELLSARLGGIYALQRLAGDHPDEYHMQVIELFCAFVRHPAQAELTTDLRNVNLDEALPAILAIEGRCPSRDECYRKS